MSSQYPRADAQFIDWAREHVALWSGQGTPPELGLSPDTLTALNTLVTVAEAEYTAHLAAQTAAEGRTLVKDTAFKELRAVLDPAIATITAFAKTTGDPGVYGTAGLTPPRQPGPRPAPERPVELTLTASPDGSLELRFRIVAAGAVFEVQRTAIALDGQQSPWVTLATTGEKRYLDQAVPAAQRQVQYRVRAILPNNAASEWSTPVPFNYGSQGSMGGPASRGTADGRPDTQAGGPRMHAA